MIRAAASAALAVCAAGVAATAQEAGAPDHGAVSDPAAAPSVEEILSRGRDLSAQEWRALTDGRTVWYLIDGAVWGRESYRGPPGEVTFQFPDGECMGATWTWRDPWFCFDFGPALNGGAPHCFRHIRYQDRLWAVSSGGAPQAIERIDQAPILCGETPVS